MTSRPEPGVQIARIEAALGDLQRRIGSGERIDTDGVARSIGALCEQLAAMPGETARAHAPALERLIATLDRLEQRLVEAQAELDRRLETLGDTGEAKA